MNENNKDFEKEYDSFKDVAEFQNNMFNPGHYIGTGKVPPTVSAPGNAAPMAVFCFITSVGIFAFGLWLFFSDARIAAIIILSIGTEDITKGLGKWRIIPKRNANIAVLLIL